jgi:hypothetical protein
LAIVLSDSSSSSYLDTTRSYKYDDIR